MAPAHKQRGAAWPQGLKPVTKSLPQGAALLALGHRNRSNIVTSQAKQPGCRVFSAVRVARSHRLSVP